MGIRKDLAIGGLTALLMGVTYATHAYRTPALADEADLRCEDVLCPTAAGCGEGGKEGTNCQLKCKSGGIINCVEAG